MYLHQYFEHQLQELLQWHNGEQQRSHRKKAGDDEMKKCREVDGKQFHLLNEGVAVAEIGEGLDVAGAKQRLILRIVAIDPLLLEEPSVGGRERSILMETDALGTEESAAEHHQRKHDDENRDDDVDDDRSGEVLQRNLVIDDVVGD